MITSIWTEKYRPQKFEQVVGQKDIVDKIKAFVKTKSMPHLLFSGSAGIGKTTLSLVIAKELFGENWRNNILELNASDERGIDVVRTKVKDFARTKAIGNVPFKIIYLDESDALTKDAQQALRRTMENYTKTCRFILSCNYSSKIIDPIQSRCATFKFTTVSEENIIDRLEMISKKEKIKTDKNGLKAIYDYSQGDLRHAINLMQATASLGEITEETVKSSAGLTKTTDVDDVLKIALSGDVIESREKMIELIKVYGMSVSDFLKYINSAVFKSKHEKLSEILEVIAKYDYRILVGANSEIQLSAMLAELAKIEK